MLLLMTYRFNFVGRNIELRNKWWSWKGSLEIAETMRRPDYGMPNILCRWASSPLSVTCNSRTLFEMRSSCCRFLRFETFKLSSLVSSGADSVLVTTASLHLDNKSSISLSRNLFRLRRLATSSSAVVSCFWVVCFTNKTLQRSMMCVRILLMQLYWM